MSIFINYCQWLAKVCHIKIIKGIFKLFKNNVFITDIQLTAQPPLRYIYIYTHDHLNTFLIQANETNKLIKDVSFIKFLFTDSDFIFNQDTIRFLGNPSVVLDEDGYLSVLSLTYRHTHDIFASRRRMEHNHYFLSLSIRFTNHTILK